MSRVPRIRFKGFEEDWEQRKVNEIIEDYIEKTTIQNQYTVLTSSQQKGIVYQEEYFSDRQVTTNANIGYYVLPRGYFTYRSRSDTNVFVFNRNDIIDKGIISYYYPVFFNKNSDSNFLLRRLNTGIERQIIMAAEGTGQHVLAHSKFKNMDIFVPYLDEQKRIGKYFESLDHLITLHQRKLEKLKIIKKSMLENLFPQNEEKTPKIRFSGFTNDWEQRKLEDYLEVSEEKNLNNEYTKENVLSVSGDVGIVNQIEFQGRSFAGILVNNYGVVKTGYVVYTKSPLKNNPYGIIKANKGMDGIVSTLYAIYKPKVNVNSNFVQIYFEQNARMNNYMQPLVNKGAKNDMKISSENALKGNVIFPIRKEQDIIVDFFFKIDHLITLHQSKLEKLQKIKKSMLESMFV